MYTFVTHWGEAAIAAVRNFESKQRTRTGMHTFHKMAAVVDPVFLEDCLQVMASDNPNVGKFHAAVTRGVKRQWYHWHIHCEGLEVHPERSMLLFLRW